MNWNDLRVLITGGSRGLGRATALRLAGQGAYVGLLSRTMSALEQTATEIRECGGHAHPFTCDVLDRARLEAATTKLKNTLGGLDAIVCAAGQLRAIGPMAQVDPDLWWQDLEVAIRGTQQTIRATLPLLRESPQASITVLVGPGYQSGLAFASGYACAQAALVRLVESLAKELEPLEIPIYAVHPGLVPTELTRSLTDTHEGRRWLPQFNEAFAEGKEVEASVTAEMVSWLIEHRPTELTGRVIPAPLTPTILETRLERIQSHDLNVLRIK
jgi:NAD(P)-dependent dehydrogenase (short-subunit alcohol dehydrogenase family)